MNDRVSSEYEINFSTNADKAASQVRGLNATLDEMGRSGEISGKGLNQASRGILAIEKALGRSEGAVRRYSASFSQLRKEVSDAEAQIQKMAQARVSGGKTDPLGYSANRMSLAEAQKIIAVEQASNITAVQAAKERVSLEDRLQKARQGNVKASKDLENLGKSRKDLAEQRLKIAQQEFQAAQKQQTRVSTGQGAGAVPYTTSEQVRAEENLLAAKKNLISAQREANAVTEQGADGYVALRYALYDVSRTAFVAAGAITAVGAGAVTAFASQERAFTEVERIAEGSIEEVQYLRKELMDMSTEIPRSFQELSQIASLGGALGIDSTALDEFTSTVAKFVTLTGVTEEAATTGFGRISQYLNIVEEDYDKLGSAILRAGNISVATEEQVLKFSSAISLPAARAGLLADEVVALGAATASFANINVEGAGSAFSRVFANIERSVAEGGESLDKFAAAAGYSSEQFRVAWGSDAGGTFNRIIQGLSQNVDGLVGNLDELGIRNERDRRVVSALALNYGDYMRIVGETTNAWREGIYMNEAYGLVLDDLVSKWEIFLNAVTNAAAAIGSQVAPTMGFLLDTAVNLLVALADFAQTPAGEVMARMAATAGALSATLIVIVGAVAAAGGSFLALRFAVQQIVASGLVTALQEVAVAIRNIGSASASSAGLAVALGNALKYLGRVTIIGAALYALSELIFNTGEAIQWIGGVLVEFSNFLLDAGQAINDFFGLARSASLDPTYIAIRDAGKGLQDWGKSMGSANKNVMDFTGGQLGLNSAIKDFNSEIPEASGGMGDYGDAAGQATKEVRTLVDYANDLAKVWSRAFEIRFSGQSTFDAITSSFLSIRQAAQDSAEKIADLRNSLQDSRRAVQGLKADMQGLTSDINIQEYFLSVAIEYGDTQRAAAIEANLAKLRADLADKTADLADKNAEIVKIQKDVTAEQQAASKALVGNSRAAIENRKTITDLVQQYQNHIQALASSGMSQSQLAKETQRLKADFIQQATQLGFNRAELGKYARAFDDVTFAISKVPRNITVKANTNPAQQAFNEMRAAANRANTAVNNLRSNAGRGFSTGPINTSSLKRASLSAERARLEAGLARAILMRDYSGIIPYTVAGARSRVTQLKNQGYYGGGFTGQGGKYDPAGLVHRGEYVIPKRDVNQATGLPYADALGRLMSGVPGMATGGRTTGSGSSGGVASVSLTAGTIQAIAQAVQPYLVIDNQVIAQAASSSYAQSNMVGAN